MPRRYRPSKRKVRPDIKYNSEQVEMCINRVMKWGKKSVARSIVYDAFDLIGERMSREPLQVFDQALKNATPLIEVKPRRVGGATYQIPIEVAPDRRVSLALRWLLASARSRSGKSMAEKLAAELMDAANKAYAHYRW